MYMTFNQMNNRRSMEILATFLIIVLNFYHHFFSSDFLRVNVASSENE